MSAAAPGRPPLPMPAFLHPRIKALRGDDAAGLPYLQPSPKIAPQARRPALLTSIFMGFGALSRMGDYSLNPFSLQPDSIHKPRDGVGFGDDVDSEAGGAGGVGGDGSDASDEGGWMNLGCRYPFEEVGDRG